MPAHTIIGAQWGDEGKGKLVDFIAGRYDYVVRFQGGNNAGHTVRVGDRTFKFQLLPSGAVRGRKVVIGNGVVVDPRVLLGEIDQMEAGGKRIQLLVSDRAHVIMPYHVALDGAAEAGAGPRIGTTKRGIGPCYADKAARLGVRMGEFVSPERFRQRLQTVYPVKRRELEAVGLKPVPPLEEVYEGYRPLGDRLRPYVQDTGGLLEDALERKRPVLFEGAQGVLLDIDHGTYPFVTSSNTVGSNAATGAGIGARHLGPTLGVAKAYVTRVGEGPFPTELPTGEGVGKTLLTVGHEYGTVTGRARRCGWLDLVALRYGVRVAGVTHLAVTKMDVLNGVEKVSTCTAYTIDGKKSNRFPGHLDDLARARPVWKDLPGWTEAGMKKGGRWTLSAPARGFLRFIEKQVGVPVVVGSVGPARHETIVLRKNPFVAA